MALRPDLAGHLLQPEGDPHIYLVDDNGSRRWVPNPPTFTNLFGSYWPPEIVLDINAVDQGPDISDGAILAKDPNMAPVYLIDNGHKRWITSPAVMDKFHLDWKQIKDVPNIVLSYVPNGPNIV